MKQRIIFATGNKNKIREIHEILGDLGWEILSMKEAGIDLDIVEDGTTFEENALIKAKSRASIPLAMQGKILLMTLRIRCFWIACKAYRGKNVLHVLSVPLQLLFRDMSRL